MDLLRIFSPKPSPKEVAKKRLNLILVNDRTNLSQQFLSDVKDALLKVISKYAEIESDNFTVEIAHTDDEDIPKPVIVASIPIKKVKRN